MTVVRMVLQKLLAPILEDHRIHYFGQENFGVCVARNAGAERAVGDFLIFLDSDDKLFPNCLSEILSNQHSEIKIAQWGREMGIWRVL